MTTWPWTATAGLIILTLLLAMLTSEGSPDSTRALRTSDPSTGSRPEQGAEAEPGARSLPIVTSPYRLETESSPWGTRPFVRLLLHDARGDPLIARAYDVFLQRGRSRVLVQPAIRRTKRDDEILIRVPVREEVRLSIWARQWGSTQRGSAEIPAGVVSIPALNEGDGFGPKSVCITTPPRLLSGSVADAADRPVAGAHIKVHGRAADRERPRIGDDLWWFTTTRADGGFKIRGHAREGWSYSVEVIGDHRSRVTAFDPGTEDLGLTAASAGSLTGKLRFDHPDQVNTARVTLEAPHLEFPVRAMLFPDGRFRLGELRPGEYELVVRIGGGILGLEARRVRGLHVRAGREERPATVQGLAVGNDFYQAMVRVTGPDSRPLARATVDWLARGGREPCVLFRETNALGEVWTWLRDDMTTDVRVRPPCPGFSWEPDPESALASVTVKDASFPLDVRLRSGRTPDSDR